MTRKIFSKPSILHNNCLPNETKCKITFYGLFTTCLITIMTLREKKHMLYYISKRHLALKLYLF